MSAPLVAVYGATGAVGRETVAQLTAGGAVRLRLGGRRAEALAAMPGIAGAADAERVVVPAGPGGLAEFCRGARLVVNCAGPSCELGDTVLRAALAAGADCVDAAGESLSHLTAPATRRVVLGAGLAPGLTGLLPRHLATVAGATTAPGAHGVRRIRGWCGGVDRFTPAAAADMIASLAGGYGVPLAAVRGGAVVRGALEPQADAVLPGFPEPVTAYPFLPVEAQRVAAALGATELEWFNVFAGRHTLAALTRRATPAELIAAADADLAGRTPYQVLSVEVELADPPGGAAIVLRATDGYRLTATVVAAAAHAVLASGAGGGPPGGSPSGGGPPGGSPSGARASGPRRTGRAVPPGVHLAAEVLDPGAVLGRLRGLAAFTVTDGPLLVEEGAL